MASERARAAAGDDAHAIYYTVVSPLPASRETSLDTLTRAEYSVRSCFERNWTVDDESRNRDLGSQFRDGAHWSNQSEVPTQRLAVPANSLRNTNGFLADGLRRMES